VKKRGIALLILVLVLIIGASGCPKKDSDGISTNKVFIGGVDGLDVGFVENEPPEQVFDQEQDPFFVTLVLTNKGEFSVPTNGVIASLSGLSQDAFGLRELNVRTKTPIESKTRIGADVVDGDNEILQFQEILYKPDLLSDFSTDLKVDVCYLYQTNALANVCLKKNTVRKETGDLCDIVNDKVVSETSAAPLQISDVKQRGSGPNKVLLSFKIRNSGSGIVYTKDAFTDKCYDNKAQKDYVSVEVKSGSRNLNVDCSKLGDDEKGAVRLVGSERTVLCDIDTSSLQESAFEEPFDIVVTYFYRNELKKKITVKSE